MKRRVTLRSRLLYLSAAAFVPLAVISGLSLVALVHQQRSQAQRAAIELARALSTAVDAELQRSISVLQVLAAGPALERGEMERFYEVTRRVMEVNPTWFTLILADASGRQLTNARVSFGTPLGPIVERESFELAVRTGTPVIGYLARGVGGQFAVPVRVPVARAGEVRYVLTAAVKPDGILEIVNRQRVPSDWVVSVFDAKGMRIARSRQHLQYLGIALGRVPVGGRIGNTLFHNRPNALAQVQFTYAQADVYNPSKWDMWTQDWRAQLTRAKLFDQKVNDLLQILPWLERDLDWSFVNTH